MHESHKVTLFIVNDFLSKIEPFKPFIPNELIGDEMGGLSRIGYVLQKARNSAPGQILAFVAGLDFCGPVAELYTGEAEMAGLEAAGFSGVVPGIHEFEYGPEKAGTMLRRTKLPIISCNLEARHQSLNGIFVPHAVYDTAFAKVGVFGLNMVAPTSVMADGPTLQCGDYVDCAESAVALLQGEGCDIIVAVTHIGLEMDKNVATKVAGIHAIFGAHSHSLTHSPVMVNGPDSWRTMVIQAGTAGAILGRLDLAVEKGLVDEQTSRWTLLPINNDIPQLQSVVDIIGPFTEGGRAHLGTTLTTTQIPLDGRFDSMLAGTSTLGNLVADAFRWRAEADVGIVSASLIQGNSIVEAGDISHGQLADMLPFSNSVFIYRVTGQELLDVLQISANALTATELEHSGQTALSPRSFLQVSGLRLKISKGGTLLSVLIQRESGLEPVDSGATYTIAGPSWFCHGGDGYNVLSRVVCWNTGYHDVEAVAGYLRMPHVVNLESEQRVTIVA